MTETLQDQMWLRAKWYALGRIEGESGRTGDPDDRAVTFAHWTRESPSDGRTMHDRWLQWTHRGEHWHVYRYGEDQDSLVTYDLPAALDYAADELEHSAAAKIDEAASLVDPRLRGDRIIPEDYHAAWCMREEADEWQVMAANLANLARQYAAEPAERAPLCQDPATAQTRLREALSHALDEVARRGPQGFAVWRCTRDECRPRPDGEEG